MNPTYHEVACPDCGAAGVTVEKRDASGEVVGVSKLSHACKKKVASAKLGVGA